MTRRATRASNARRNQQRAGVALLLGVAASFGALIYGAATLDHERGIGVEASLASAGIGNATWKRWHIIHINARGDLYVDDYGLSLTDCIRGASARNRVFGRGMFQCERES